MTSKGVRNILLGSAAGLALAAPGAMAQTSAAAQTRAGTTITNQATATYTVNGDPRSATSNISTFVVDRKVNFTVVTAQADTTKVRLGQTGRVTTYTVTNLTNAAQDFILDPDQQNLSLGILPGTDNFDVSNMKAYVDSNGNGVYDAGVDTQQYIDELAPDASATVFIVADVPNQSNASLAFVSLHVIVAAGDTPGAKGTALIPTDLNILNADNDVDIVFADGDSDGAFPGDIARNGQGRAYAAYEVLLSDVDLRVVKTSRIISDGVSALNPKALPGAIVEYCLTASNNTAGTPAGQLTLSDVIPANTVYVPGSIAIGQSGAATACLLSGIAQNDDGSAPASGTYRGSFDTATKTVRAVIPSLAGNASVAASFRVTIK